MLKRNEEMFYEPLGILQNKTNEMGEVCRILAVYNKM